MVIYLTRTLPEQLAIRCVGGEQDAPFTAAESGHGGPDHEREAVHPNWYGGGKIEIWFGDGFWWGDGDDGDGNGFGQRIIRMEDDT